MNYHTINLRGLAQLGLLAFTFAAAGFGQTPTPVVVKNGVREPVPIRDHSAQQAIAFKMTFHFTASASEMPAERYTVPFGKRLVIEHISYGVVVNPGLSMQVRFFTRLDNTDHTTYLGNFDRWPTGSFDSLAGDRMVRLYADAGTTVSAQVFTSGVNGPNRLGFVTFHGYLVDMPLIFQVTP
jgi:hypothetical protein